MSVLICRMGETDYFFETLEKGWERFSQLGLRSNPKAGEGVRAETPACEYLWEPHFRSLTSGKTNS